MRSIKILMAITIAVACMQACSSKDFDHCDESLVPTVTVDQQVIAGSTINLSVSGIDNVHMYNWRGPNKFFSHDQNPQVTNASAASAGRYTVDVITNDGCILTTTSDSVKVASATPPCKLTNNYAEFSNTFDISYYWVGGSVNGGSYFVEANGSGGDLDMEFAGTNRPGIGLYSIQPLGGIWGPGNVRISLTNSGWLWYPSGGKVYVNAVNGKLIVSFCNIEFSSNGYKSIINCQVTVP